MKLTKSQPKQLIKEQLQRTLNETDVIKGPWPGSGEEEYESNPDEEEFQNSAGSSKEEKDLVSITECANEDDEETVIKDSKELIYLLWAMSIGLACGSENWMAIIVGTLIIACLILIIYYFQYGTNYKKDLVLIISSSENIDNNKITNILDEYKCNYNLRSVDKTGDRYQIVYELKNIILVKNSSKDIMEKIEKEIKVENISILSPNLTHPL